MTHIPPPVAALPSARVLSYITTIGSPTRVRRIASISLLVLGIIDLLVGGTFLYLALVAIYNLAVFATDFGTMPSGFGGIFQYGFTFIPRLAAMTYIMQASQLFVSDYLFFSVSIAATLIAGILQLLFARAVNRGSRVASLCCRMALIPSQFLFLFLAGLLFVFPVLLIFFSRPREYWSLALVPLGLLAVLIVLLLVDLWRFLTWVARAPAAEKPPVPFLP